MFLKSPLKRITLALVYSLLQPLTAATNVQTPGLLQTVVAADQLETKLREKAPQKVVLFGVEGVILFGDPKNVKGGKIGDFLGFTTEKVKRELFETLEPITMNNFSSSGIYPNIFEYWLVVPGSSDRVHDTAYHYVKKHTSFMKKMRLETAVDIAFSNRQASTFSLYPDTIALALRCKNSGCIIETSTSWNKESFENLKNVQSSTLRIFNGHNISGNCGILAAKPNFYDPIIKKYGIENIVLVDILPENIRAAKARGIKTISFTSAANAERELKSMGFLS